MPYKEFCVFFSGKLFYKSNRKLFSCLCIAWHKHSRRWEDSRQLSKPSTSSRVCITVSNSPNASRVYIRLCKLGKRFLLLKFSTTDFFEYYLELKSPIVRFFRFFRLYYDCIYCSTTECAILRFYQKLLMIKTRLRLHDSSNFLRFYYSTIVVLFSDSYKTSLRYKQVFVCYFTILSKTPYDKSKSPIVRFFRFLRFYYSTTVMCYF